MDKLFNIAGLFIGVAMVTTIVAHPDTAKDITAGGDAFDNSLKAAEGS
jgi:hypothetical protein